MKRSAIGAALTGLFAAAVAASSPAAGPVSAVLLIDVSFSMTDQRLADESRFERAVRAIGDALQPGDRVLLGIVGRRPVFGSDFHGTAKELRDDWRHLSAVSAADRFGPSPLYDAIEDAAAKLRDAPGSRGIVLWTDGRPSGNVHGSAEVATDAAHAGIPVHVIEDEYPWPPWLGERPAWMASKACAIFDVIVRKSGGSCTPHRDRRGAPSRQLAEIVRRLRG